MALCTESGENQRVVYNGHKRVHSLKFQSVVLPNGLIGNLAGPWVSNNRIYIYQLAYIQTKICQCILIQ